MRGGDGAFEGEGGSGGGFCDCTGFLRCGVVFGSMTIRSYSSFLRG